MKRKYLKHRKREKKWLGGMGVAIAICLMVSIGILGRIVEEIETERSNIVSVQGTAKEDWTEETFQSFTDRLFTSYVQTDSLTMHYKVTDPAAYGVEKNAVTWGDINSEAERNRLEEEKKNYETLLSFDYETLSEEEQLTYDVLNDYFERELKMEGMELYEEVLGKYSGITSQIPVLLSEYAFYTEEDVEDYLELCRQIPDYFDEIIQYEKERAEAGLFMSDSNVDGVIAQCASFIETPDENVLIETFPDHISELTNVSEEKKEEWIQENTRLVKEVIIPAYEKVMEELEAMKGTGITESPAFLPRGKEYYEVKAQMAVGTTKSIEEIKNMVEKSVAEQMNIMQDMCEENPSIMVQASASAYPSGTWEAMLNDLKNKMMSDFPALSDVSLEINTVHESLQGNLNPAFYFIPPIDHAWENVIYINENPEYDHSNLYLTLAHEGFPGHLYQNVYFANQNSEPIRYLLSFPGYTEGWAIYVENLAYHYMDTMEEDIREFLRINYFTSLGLYARMDIGINYDGWTLDQLKEFIRTYFDISEESAAQDMYDMMTNDPANYLSYYVGGIMFQQLLETAKEEWGDSFSAMDFHQRVLEIGPCSFEILEKYLFS